MNQLIGIRKVPETQGSDGARGSLGVRGLGAAWNQRLAWHILPTSVYMIS